MAHRNQSINIVPLAQPVRASVLCAVCHGFESRKEQPADKTLFFYDFSCASVLRTTLKIADVYVTDDTDLDYTETILKNANNNNQLAYEDSGQFERAI